MNESLSDIEALTLQCRSDESRSFIAEAALCYRAGAFRAAIVSTWIAVVFDLIDKMRELALGGDAAAKSLESQFQTYIDQINAGNQQGVTTALEFERNILSACKDKLQFFDQQQFMDLQRLREDRHRCAHPSFQQAGVPYKPSAEQARLHIRNAVIHVLSQPPVQGKAALARMTELVASEYFPDDINKARLQLKKAGMDKPTGSLVHSVVDTLIFGFLTQGDVLYEKRQVVPALNALHEMHPGLVEIRLGKQLGKAVRDVGDDRCLWAFYLIAYVHRAWDLIDQPSRDKVERFVEVGPYKDLAPAMEALGSFEQLRPVVESRVRQFDLDQLAGVTESKGLQAVLKERAIELLAESRSWDRTNLVLIKALLPLFDALTTDDVATIIRLPQDRSADLIGARGFGLFVDRVRKTGLIPNEELNSLLLENGGGYLVPQEPQT